MMMMMIMERWLIFGVFFLILAVNQVYGGEIKKPVISGVNLAQKIAALHNVTHPGNNSSLSSNKTLAIASSNSTTLNNNSTKILSNSTSSSKSNSTTAHSNSTLSGNSTGSIPAHNTTSKINSTIAGINSTNNSSHSNSTNLSNNSTILALLKNSTLPLNSTVNPLNSTVKNSTILSNATAAHSNATLLSHNVTAASLNSTTNSTSKVNSTALLGNSTVSSHNATANATNFANITSALNSTTTKLHGNLTTTTKQNATLGLKSNLLKNLSAMLHGNFSNSKANSTAKILNKNSTMINSTAHGTNLTNSSLNSTKTTQNLNSTVNATTTLANGTIIHLTGLNTTKIVNNSTANNNLTMPTNSSTTNSTTNATITKNYTKFFGSIPALLSNSINISKYIQGSTKKSSSPDIKYPNFNFIVKDNVTGIPCLLANLSIALTAIYNKTDHTVATHTLQVPDTALTSGTCDKKNSKMMLAWKENENITSMKHSNNSIITDEWNKIFLHFVKHGSQATLDQIEAIISLDKKNFPQAIGKLVVGNSTKNLRLFETNTKTGNYICDISKNVDAKNISIAIKNISLIAFNSNKDFSSRNVEHCPVRSVAVSKASGMSIGAIIGVIAGIALLICGGMFLITTKAKNAFSTTQLP